MNKVSLVSRYLLGLVYAIFGLNGLLWVFTGSGFINPPPPEGDALAFFTGLSVGGYMMPMIKIFETVCGALLLSGFFVPLSLVLLAPITVNIALFHFVIDPGGAAMAIAMVVAHIFAALAYGPLWRPLFGAKA